MEKQLYRLITNKGTDLKELVDLHNKEEEAILQNILTLSILMFTGSLVVVGSNNNFLSGVSCYKKVILVFVWIFLFLGMIFAILQYFLNRKFYKQHVYERLNSLEDSFIRRVEISSDCVDCLELTIQDLLHSLQRVEKSFENWERIDKAHAAKVCLRILVSFLEGFVWRCFLKHKGLCEQLKNFTPSKGEGLCAESSGEKIKQNKREVGGGNLLEEQPTQYLNLAVSFSGGAVVLLIVFLFLLLMC